MFIVFHLPTPIQSSKDPSQQVRVTRSSDASLDASQGPRQSGDRQILPEPPIGLVVYPVSHLTQPEQ